jgi:hypothetical protein
MLPQLCKNCDHTFQGNFCCNCGQKAATHEIDFKFIVHEVPHSAFHLSKGIFYTIKEMSTRPGKTIQEYIRGKRVNHFPPLTYLLILTSLFIFIRGLQYSLDFREINLKRASGFDKFLDQNVVFVFLLLIPFYAFIYKLFHRKTNYNYWQFLVAQTFIIGHIILIMILPQVVFFFFPKTRESIKGYFLIFTVLFQIFTYYQLVKEHFNNKFLLIIREIICYLISTIIAFAFTFSIFGLVKLLLDRYQN